MVEMAVEPNSPLLGKTIAESGLKDMPDIFLFGILREGKLKTPIQDKAIFRDGDRLVFTGESSHLEDLISLDNRTILREIILIMELTAIPFPSSVILMQEILIMVHRSLNRISVKVLLHRNKRHGIQVRNHLHRVVICLEEWL